MPDDAATVTLPAALLAWAEQETRRAGELGLPGADSETSPSMLSD